MRIHVDMKKGTGPARLPRHPGNHDISHVFDLLLGGPSENRYGKIRQHRILATYLISATLINEIECSNPFFLLFESPTSLPPKIQHLGCTNWNFF